jgi:nucleotide-binding universal stress UspA family protein
MDIRRILCPVDLSETSMHALQHAASLSRQYHAALTVQHVYVPVFMPVPLLPPPAERASDEAIAHVRESVRSFIESSAAMLDSGDSPEIVVDVGHPASVILGRAGRMSADLIVLGTHGASGFERLLLGSTAEKVLRKASAPVLTVPPRVHATSKLPFRRVLCGVDFSEWSQAAAALAGSLAAESGAALILAHVIEWPWSESHNPSFSELSTDQQNALAEYRRYVERTARVRLAGFLPSAISERIRLECLVTHGKPYVELLRVAAENDTDIIVLGVHGRNPVDLALFGSTTTHIVRAATCPVLTLRN